MSFADKNAGKTTLGLVMVLMDGKSKDPYQSTGHTAVMFRREGKIEAIRGWRPKDETAEADFEKAVDGDWKNDIEMLKCAAAESFEFAVSSNELTAMEVIFKSDAASKWKYFFFKEEAPKGSGRVFVKDNNKNCVEAALHVLRRDPTPKAIITQINALRDKVKASDFRVFGYSQQAAIEAARELQKANASWL